MQNNLTLSGIQQDYCHIDDCSLVVTHHYDKGIGDCVGRSSKFLLFYGESNQKQHVARGIKDCFKEFKHSGHGIKDGTFYRLYTYNFDATSIPMESARDHIIMGIAGLKISGLEYEFIENYISSLPRRASENYRFNLGNRIWFKSLYSNFYSYLYTIDRIPRILLAAANNFVWRKILNIKTYKSPEELIHKRRDMNKFKTFISSNIMYPTYASLFTLFAIESLNSSICKKVLGKLIRLHFEETNYFARAFSGQKYTVGEIACILNNYSPTRSYRWSERLDDTNRRSMQVYFLDKAFNNIEVGSLLGCFLNNIDYDKLEDHEKTTISAIVRSYSY